jgi:hypothetical protein
MATTAARISVSQFTTGNHVTIKEMKLDQGDLNTFANDIKVIVTQGSVILGEFSGQFAFVMIVVESSRHNA